MPTVEEIIIAVKAEEGGLKTLNKGIADLEARLNKLKSNQSGNVQNFKWFKDLEQTLANGKIAAKQFQDSMKNTASAFRTDAIKGFTSEIGNLAVAYIGARGASELFNLSLNAAKFNTLRSNFIGTEKDIESFRNATAGTVDDASLLKLSNQASDLGISLKDQTILMSLAEDAADKYGTSTEEGFQKVVNATEGSVKGLKSLGIQKEVYEAIVKRMAGVYGKEIDALDADIQKQIRLQAIIEASGTTYEDATKKVQDSADKHEHFAVVAKNLADRFGGDLFNAITGVGTAYTVLNKLSDNVTKAFNVGIGVTKLTSEAWKNLAGDVPILGDALSVLTGLLYDVAAAQTAVNNSVPKLELGFSPEELIKKKSNAKDVNAEGTRSVVKKSGSGSTKTEKNAIDELITKIRNQIELQRLTIGLNAEYLISQQKILQSADNENLALEDRVKLLNEIEGQQKRIVNFLTGGKSIKDFTMMLQGATVGVYQRFIGTNPNAMNDPRQDETTAEILEKEKMSAMYADSMWQNFQGMLQATGLMQGQFGQIVGLINSIINAGSSAFGFFDALGGLLGFLPGGNVVGGVLQGGGALSSGFTQPITNNVSTPVLIEGTAKEYFEYRVLSKGSPQYNAMLSRTSL